MERNYPTLKEAQADGWITVDQTADLLAQTPVVYTSPDDNPLFTLHFRCHRIRVCHYIDSRYWSATVGIYEFSAEGVRTGECLLPYTGVHFDERNKIGKPGCFRDMFRRDEVENLVRQYSN